MKCKICGGTGTSNTCVNGTFKPCTFCDGTGEYEPFDADIELDKLDSEPQTNEEWRKTCSTEEFTEELAKVVLDLVSWNNDPKPSEVRNILKAWLKRQHKNEVAK